MKQRCTNHHRCTEHRCELVDKQLSSPLLTTCINKQPGAKRMAQVSQQAQILATCEIYVWMDNDEKRYDSSMELDLPIFNGSWRAPSESFERKMQDDSHRSRPKMEMKSTGSLWCWHLIGEPHCEPPVYSIISLAFAPAMLAAFQTSCWPIGCPETSAKCFSLASLCWQVVSWIKPNYGPSVIASLINNIL